MYYRFVLQKNTICLVVWLFAVTVLIFPEAGMVIYMSVQYWVGTLKKKKLIRILNRKLF